MLLAASAMLAAVPAYAQDTAPAAPANGGFYAGVHLGYGWSKPGYEEPDYPDYDLNPTMQGLAGGLVAGYDMPMNGLTLGIEGDIGLLDAEKKANEDADYNDYTAFDMKWNAHLRARVGTELGGARLFVAGGLAIAKLEADDTDDDWGSFTKTYTGWTLGGGAEQRVSDRLSIRAEYLHDEFGRKNGEQSCCGGSSDYDISVKPDSDLFRFAVLYAL